MKEVAILGAGGHTRSSINLLRYSLPDRTFKIYDNSYCPTLNEAILEIPLVGKPEQITQNSEVFLSIGDNVKRSEMFERYYSQLLLNNLIHPQAFIEKSGSFGISNQIYAHVYINSAVTLGNNNIINTSAVIEHEVTIGSHNHLAVGAKLCGRVKVGSRNFIGCGAIVIDGVSVGDNVIIGAGAVVIKDILEPGTYVGIPAVKVK